MTARAISLASSVAIAVVAVTLATGLVALGHSISVLAALVCLVTAIPFFFERRLDLFAPWTYMFYYVLLNVLVRQIFVDFEVNGDATNINGIFYLDKPHEFMTQSTAILLLGFSFLTLGYLGTRNRPLQLDYRIFNSSSYEPVRFKRAVTLMLILSLAALTVFFRLTFTSVGEFAIEMLSRHRGLSEDITEYKAYGYLRLLIGLSSIAVYLTFVQLKNTRVDRRYNLVIFFLALLTSVAMAFYSQSRAALVFVFLNLIFINYYIDDHRFPWKAFSILAPFALTLFFVTSALRAGSGVNLQSSITPMSIVAPIVLNNGGIDASKTGHVIDYVDDTQDYKFGQTLFQFVIAVVPRQLWTDKPVNLDTFVGEKIYGAETFGASAVPPGFIAEMYLNFWYAGIVFGALALGAIMKKIRNLLDANKRNRNFVVVYVVTLQSFGMSMLASGVSSTIMGVLMTGIPLILTLSYVTPKRTLQSKQLVVSQGFAG
jgi:oligosaccharide repeat unit polymerase